MGLESMVIKFPDEPAHKKLAAISLCGMGSEGCDLVMFRYVTVAMCHVL